jgi:putative RecB family exonuclease
VSAVGSSVAKDALHISASQVATFVTCPERFRLQYVQARPPSHRSADLAFGSAIHEALAEHHRCLQKEPAVKPPLEELLTAFDRHLSTQASGEVAILWEDDEGPERLRDTGRAMLALYHEKTTRRRVLAVEQGFAIPRFHPQTGRQLEEQLVGVVDVVEEDDDGTVWITELKTAARRFDDARLAYDNQATIYAMARAALGFPTARVRFRVLLKGRKPAIETYPLQRDELQVTETNRVVHEVLRAVDAGIFYPHRGWQCSTCPYRAACGT